MSFAQAAAAGEGQVPDTVSVAGCKGAVTASFLTAVSMAGCKGAASKDFCTFFDNFGTIFGLFLASGGPWNGLGDPW